MAKYLIFLIIKRKQLQYWKLSCVEKCVLARLPFMAKHSGNSQRNQERLGHACHTLQ